MHFITTYSTYFAQDLAATPLKLFLPVDTSANRSLIEKGNSEECMLAYRTEGEYWGRKRTVILTYNPAAARKQNYMLARKMEALEKELLSMSTKVNDKMPQWTDQRVIQERYLHLCQRLHIPAELYIVTFDQSDNGLVMNFCKDADQVQRKQVMFGKNIIITDNTDWTTDEIVSANLDRWQVENSFRLSHDEDLVGTQPVRHWTDSKMRCHLFTCVVAMTYLRRIELKLTAAGVNRTAEDVMDDMQHLHSVLSLKKGSRKPIRRIETPIKSQAEILAAFGHQIDASGVLQNLTS